MVRAARLVAGVAALAVATLAGGTAAARADSGDDPTVVALVFAGGQAPVSESVTVATLLAGCPTYTGQMDWQGPSGPYSAGLPQNAWSLPAVLGCLPTPIALSQVTGVTVLRGNRGPELSPDAQLLAGDLDTPSDFQLSDALPVVAWDGTNLLYDRPSRSPTDDTAADDLQVTDPATLTFEVFEGPLLTVTATASPPAPVQAGTTVTFAASVPPAATGVTYDWDFDGAGPPDSAQAAPQVTFATPGLYEVSVQVTDDAGGGGGYVVPITVTAPPGAPAPPPPVASPTEQSGGGSVTTADAPASGPATATSTTTTSIPAPTTHATRTTTSTHTTRSARTTKARASATARPHSTTATSSSTSNAIAIPSTSTTTTATITATTTTTTTSTTSSSASTTTTPTTSTTSSRTTTPATPPHSAAAPRSAAAAPQPPAPARDRETDQRRDAAASRQASPAGAGAGASSGPAPRNRLVAVAGDPRFGARRRALRPRRRT